MCRLDKNGVLIIFGFRFPSQTQTPWMFGDAESKPTEELKSETLKPSVNQAQRGTRVATAGAVSALRPQFIR